jgi:hypothetical protein
MRVVISQPFYFPWIGFMAQVSVADTLVWLDDAQFSKGSFVNRVQVKLPTGTSMMSVPLKGSGSFTQIINLEATGLDWRAGHLNMLRRSFDRRPCIENALNLFQGVVGSNNSSLCDVLIRSAQDLADCLGVLPKRILRSSQLKASGSSWNRVLDIVKEVGGNEYVTGHGAIKYLDHEAFEKHGVSVEYMQYAPVAWPQPFGEFTPFVSTLDILASLPADIARTHLNPSTINWRAFKSRKETQHETQ